MRRCKKGPDLLEPSPKNAGQWVPDIHGPDEIFKLVTGGRIYRQGSCGRVWTIVMLQGDCHTGAASAHHASPALKSLLGPDCVVVVGLYVQRIVK